MPAPDARKPELLPCLAWALVLIGTLWLLGMNALGAWFRADDFALLLLVERPAFDPWASLWPVSARTWWAYRPLGTELYFAGCRAWFGLSAPGYHALTLVVHAGNAVLLTSLARAFGLSRWPARLAGFLYLAAPALSLHLMRAATFHYQAATLFTLIALRVRPAADGHLPRSVLSAAAFLAGLLCNRSALLVIPVVVALAIVDGDREGVATPAHRYREGLWRGLRRTAPYLALAALVLSLDRFAFAPAPSHPHYGLFLDADVHRRLGALLRELVGPWPGAWVCVAVLVVGALLHVAGRGSGAPPHAGVTPVALLWLGLALAAATLLFYLPHVRFVFVAVAPACLLLSALFARAVPRPLQAWAAVLVAALWLPAAPLWQRAAAPADAPLRAAHDYVQAHNPHLQRPIVVDYGGPGMADATGLERYRRATYRFAHLRLVAPRADLSLRLRDVGAGSTAAPVPAQALRMRLLPDLRLVPGPAPDGPR